MSYTEIWCAYFWELSSQISLISQLKQSCLGYTTVKPRVRSKCKDVSWETHKSEPQSPEIVILHQHIT